MENGKNEMINLANTSRLKIGLTGIFVLSLSALGCAHSQVQNLQPSEVASAETSTPSTPQSGDDLECGPKDETLTIYKTIQVKGPNGKCEEIVFY